MNKQTRMIFSDNGVLSDKTLELNDFLSGTTLFPYETGNDSLYIGSLLPFNSLYFDIGSPNAVSCVPTVQIWWANGWHNAFDIMDGTASSGKSLAQSGLLTFVPDSFKGWDRWGRNDSTSFGLQSLNIFDLYWVKITWNASMTGTTSLKYIGQKFATDTDLYIKYPDLANSSLKTAFAAGKTTWDSQHFAAAEEIVEYLIRTKTIATKDQLLDWAILKNAGIHKCAELIYAALGKDYIKNREVARIGFKEALDLPSLRVDNNGNATLDGCEISNVVGTLYR